MRILKHLAGLVLLAWAVMPACLHAQGLIPNGEQTFLDANGNPIASGWVYFDVPNTDTPKDTWQDPGLMTLNSNPVHLDMAGRAVIWGDGSYRQIVKDSAFNLIWDKPTTTSGTTPPPTATAGVFNVRTQFGAVPNGSTNNEASFSDAFDTANAFTGPGAPTVYFDCDLGLTACKYNYGGSGVSSINPTQPMAIVCAPGVVLNYTGTGHAVDLGATGLSAPDERGHYTVQGCTFEGGATYTAGIYVNNYTIFSDILNNVFQNFGNQAHFTIVLPGNNWEPRIDGNKWIDNDGFTKSMVDAHAAINGALLFTNNSSECATADAMACSVATTGVGIWLHTGHISGNVIQYHYPAVRITSCQTCGGGGGIFILNNHFEGNEGGLGAAITYGDPGAAAENIGVFTTIADNFFYWPVQTGIMLSPYLSDEPAASGTFTISKLNVLNNCLCSNDALAEMGVPLLQTRGTSNQNFAIGNYGGPSGHIIDQASTVTLFDTTTGNAAQFGAYYIGGPNYVTAFSGAPVSLYNSTTKGLALYSSNFHWQASPLLCADSTGSGTTQACKTLPEYDPSVTNLAPVAGDMILYKTTTQNTGALTIDVNETGVPHAVKKNQGATDLSAGDIHAGIYNVLTFDGTNWDTAF